MADEMNQMCEIRDNIGCCDSPRLESSTLELDLASEHLGRGR